MTYVIKYKIIRSDVYTLQLDHRRVKKVRVKERLASVLYPRFTTFCICYVF